MGGHLVTRVAAACPSRFDRLLLLDPAIVAPKILEMIAAAADRIPPVRRRNRWASPSEMAARLRDRGGFSRWDRHVFDDYCRYGFRPPPRGGYLQLAFPPGGQRAGYNGQAYPG